ncbi:hypothetical protein DL770_008197 [Monosporascus sp. CRB-9-2]|nr:hypothetical protein DL770_008197 [Monosporascus sp. CRB-9-2]
MAPLLQTTIVQSPSATPGKLPLAISLSEPVPTLPSSHHVLVRVLAVALNPNDHKMIEHFPLPGYGAGCDFCGVVSQQPDNPKVNLPKVGTRVCGTVFPYAAADDYNRHRRTGAFSEWVVADARLLVQVPDHWDDLRGAAFGGVGWSTVALAMSHPNYLALSGLPSSPAETMLPVLVYGGGTATGTMACQLLKLYVQRLSLLINAGRVIGLHRRKRRFLTRVDPTRSGYAPIAVVHSTASEALALQYGAVGTVLYTSSTDTAQSNQHADAIRDVANGQPIRHALDCITDLDSAALCFAVIARTGGRYVCLEQFRSEWHTRRVVSVKEVMGYEILGYRVDLGATESVYSRQPSEEASDIGRRWAAEVQELVSRGLIEPHPIQEVPGKWGGILTGLTMLQSGKVRGRKLVVQLSSKDD